MLVCLGKAAVVFLQQVEQGMGGFPVPTRLPRARAVGSKLVQLVLGCIRAAAVEPSARELRAQLQGKQVVAHKLERGIETDAGVFKLLGAHQHTVRIQKRLAEIGLYVKLQGFLFVRTMQREGLFTNLQQALRHGKLGRVVQLGRKRFRIIGGKLCALLGKQNVLRIRLLDLGIKPLGALVQIERLHLVFSHTSSLKSKARITRAPSCSELVDSYLLRLRFSLTLVVEMPGVRSR